MSRSYNVLKEKTAATVGAVSFSSGAFLSATKVSIVTVKFSASPTTSENITVTLDSAAGADYDTVIRSIDPSDQSTDLEKQNILFQINQTFMAGDAIVVAYANTDTAAQSVAVAIELDYQPNV